MGNSFSTISDSNPSSSNSSTMSSSQAKSKIEPTHESKSKIEPTHESKPQIEPTHQNETQNANEKNQEEIGENDTILEEEEEEEEGECGFCLFMKGGGCKDSFIEWEKCIEEGEKNKEDIVEKCFEVTSALKKCMEAHSDYYAPILQAEKAAQEDLEKEVKEKEQKNEGNDTVSVQSETKLEEKSNSS